MAKFTTASYKEHASVTNSIAFLPTVISALFFLLAIGMFYFESTPLSSALERKIPLKLVYNEDNARLILNTLATGTISLTVFSFSMVMIVLSQASSNLSPRVIPGLTTARPHQVVLGFYIGTIIYILLLLLGYKPPQEDLKTPAIAILLGLAFGVICLALFVFFIHSISKAIQVDNIMNNLFLDASKALALEEKAVNRTHTPINTDSGERRYTLINNANGYLEQVDLTELQGLAKQHHMQLEILVEVGAFIVEGTPLLQLSRDPMKQEALEEKLQKCFALNQEEVVMKDFEQGVKQLSEIAVKALSPGINDPGTAMKAIDFLTLLFIRRMKHDKRNCLLDEEKQVRVIDYTLTLDELLHRYLSPIRTYGKADFQVDLRLLKCLQSLLLQHPKAEKVAVIRKHIYAVVSDADESVHNVVDRERLNSFIKVVNKLLPEAQDFELLKA